MVPVLLKNAQVTGFKPYPFCLKNGQVHIAPSVLQNKQD